MNEEFFSLKKVAHIFGGSHLKPRLEDLSARSEIPFIKRHRSGALYRKGWFLNDLPLIGEKAGFFAGLSTPVSMAIFTTKGGVLKSTLALNLARICALHNLKTCVIGLDIQGDITRTLGFENDLQDFTDLKEIMDKMNRTKGLADFFSDHARLNEIIYPTNLKNLFLIPETPELVAFNDSLSNINRREFWIKEKIVHPLKKNFDVIIMDCSPNWNKLTTNALVACDNLISPLECKINNFRNFKVFRHFLAEFKKEMLLDFEDIFIPTRYQANHKLSIEIKNWYQENVEGHTKEGIKESVLGEEATALNRSFLELDPRKPASIEMRSMLEEVFVRLEGSFERRSRKVENSNTAFSHSFTRREEEFLR